MKTTLLGFFVLVYATSVFAQGPCTEQAVRKLAPKAAWTDDVYFFSGALDKPVVGMAAFDAASKPVAAQREKENYGQDTPQRIVAAPSGEMAYEYGTDHIAFTDKKTGKPIDFTAAYLRVWKAEGASCKVAAMMAEPERRK